MNLAPSAGGVSRPVHLLAGDCFVGGAGQEVSTVLGSCVSITLWHPARRLGAMSHFTLPQRHAGRPRGSRVALDARYGPEALATMLRDLAARGVAGADCEAKLFGGASMFAGLPRRTDAAAQVGRANGEAALALLRAEGIRVVSYSLFGTGHRRIVFDTATGDVWAHRDRRAPHAMPHDLAERTGAVAPGRQASASDRAGTP